jgi:multisubunit Na+/H+ antiporter MnhF subunit
VINSPDEGRCSGAWRAPAHHQEAAVFPSIFYLALAWIAALLAVNILLVVRARSMMVRILASDTLTLVLVALLVLFAYHERSAFYLDAALLLALLSFIGVIAASRYYRTGRPF